MIQIGMMMKQLVPRHLAKGVDEVPTIYIVEPILIGIVSIGMMIEVVGGQIFNTHVTMRIEGTYAILLLVVHEGSDGLTLVGAGPS